jgi:Mor family transcriptional regulator
MDLENAKEIVQLDMKQRAEEMGKELEQLLKKYNCSLQVGEQGIFIQANI